MFKLTQKAIEDAHIWACLQDFDLVTILVNPKTLSEYNKRTFKDKKLLIADIKAAGWEPAGTVWLKPDKKLGENEVKIELVMKKLPKLKGE